MFFYLPILTGFFRKAAIIYNARDGQKTKHMFFGNARPKSNARAHLKQRKKYSGFSPATVLPPPYYVI